MTTTTRRSLLDASFRGGTLLRMSAPFARASPAIAQREAPDDDRADTMAEARLLTMSIAWQLLGAALARELEEGLRRRRGD